MASALLLCLLALHSGRVSAAAEVGLRHEPGVETRLLLSALAHYRPLPQLALTSQATLAGLDNTGLASYGLGVVLQPLPGLPLQAALEAAHQQWSEWQTGENRASGLLTADPRPRFRLGVGAAWRVPLTGRGRWDSPLHWHSDMPEWNLVYLVCWHFLSYRDWHLAAFLSNLDRYGLTTPQQLPFGLEAAHHVRSQLLVQARVAASIKGLSGPLGSLGSISASVGVSGGY
ncbi:MAG: hypothetical protein ABIK37_05005 [candidate division WOR-3 bacterium]